MYSSVFTYQSALFFIAQPLTEMMEVMISALTKLSWERVDVKFGGGKQRLLAHSSIQASCIILSPSVVYSLDAISFSLCNSLSVEIKSYHFLWWACIMAR